MSTIPGLFVIGEANFSDHGANRLGASALMQGLADGYFILPATLPDFLATTKKEVLDTKHPAFLAVEKETRELTGRLLGIQGKRSVDSFHRELGRLMWENVGMGRNAKGLTEALRRVPEIRADYWKNVKVVGSGESLNRELEKAGRVADFLEFAELMVRDALMRDESAGGHFREEHQTEDGEARRDDEKFTFVGAWEYKGPDAEPVLHREPLAFEHVKPTQRSYK
jgi:succinate dehydrogenase / fumarate reductase flavoprotein subunit